MRFPVDSWEQWYIASGFGEKRPTYYHDGIDLNLKTGGDTDLGEPIFSITDGIVTSVHNHTTKPTFGNHIHIQHDGPWGTVYCHHAHCDSIFVKTGDAVKEGQKIATVGKSGTDVAHLHWAVKLEPTGVDGIAKTLEDLAKWTDPVAFVEKWMKQTEVDCEQVKQDLKDEQQRLIDCRNERQKLQNDTISLTHQVEELDNKYDTFIRSIAQELHSTMDEAQIMAAVRTGRQQLDDTIKSLHNLQTSLQNFLDSASEIRGSPLTSLEAVLEALQPGTEAQKPIVVQKPVIQRIIDFFWRR